MKALVATKGPKIGICNICGAYGKLTEDHTPPKGCIKISQVVVHHITERLNMEKPKSKGRLLNNGVKYRTLCSTCNNTLLGKHYDPDFIGFVNRIGSYLKSDIYLPEIMHIKAKPQRVMRSLLGHICAQGVNRYDSGAMTKVIKEYFLDKDKILPSNIKIYYWAYPYQGHVMARDCGYLDTRVGDSMAIWFLKFFPIGFMITFNEPSSYNFDLNVMSRWAEEDIDFETEIPIQLKNLTPQFWPEAPATSSVLLYGQDAITSFDIKKANKQIGDRPRFLTRNQH